MGGGTRDEGIGREDRGREREVEGGRSGRKEKLKYTTIFHVIMPVETPDLHTEIQTKIHTKIHTKIRPPTHPPPKPK